MEMSPFKMLQIAEEILEFLDDADSSDNQRATIMTKQIYSVVHLKFETIIILKSLNLQMSTHNHQKILEKSTI